MIEKEPRKVTLGDVLALTDGDKLFEEALFYLLKTKGYSIKTIPYRIWLKFVETYYKVKVIE